MGADDLLPPNLNASDVPCVVQLVETLTQRPQVLSGLCKVHGCRTPRVRGQCYCGDHKDAQKRLARTLAHGDATVFLVPRMKWPMLIYTATTIGESTPERDAPEVARVAWRFCVYHGWFENTTKRGVKRPAAADAKSLAS